MDIQKKDEVRKKIQRLEAELEHLSKEKRLQLVYDILVPLLRTEDDTMLRYDDAFFHPYDLFTASELELLEPDLIQSITADIGSMDLIAIAWSKGNNFPLIPFLLHLKVGASTRQVLEIIPIYEHPRSSIKSRKEHRWINNIYSIDSIKDWWARVYDSTPPANHDAHAIILAMGKALARAIANDPSQIWSVEWRDLERLVAIALEGIGFDVKLTQGSGDGGKDVVLNLELSGKEHTYYVELKHWRTPVGDKAVRKFHTVITRDNCDGGLFLASSGYTSGVYEGLTEIERPTLRLGDGDKIVALCRNYIRSEQGAFSPLTLLPDILFEDTCDPTCS